MNRNLPYSIQELVVVEEDQEILIQAVVDESTGVYMEVEALRLMFELLSKRPKTFQSLLYMISDLLEEDEESGSILDA